MQKMHIRYTLNTTYRKLLRLKEEIHTENCISKMAKSRLGCC